ncbi:hypothetical protein HYW41_03200 [Candidatus Daviesbacteria bacterium]|nr:hypothetical protein [Candidatus Daviesbacteria bacterium]
MAVPGYKQLLSYKLSEIAFLIGWEFVPLYYHKYEDHRQRDQIKQALRSNKQNIVEGCSERSLSTKLKLYDVAKSSGMEALEDFEDILKLENLPFWDKGDPRLFRLRLAIENYPSNSPNPSYPSSLTSVKAILKINKEGLGGKEGIEGIVNYLIDVLIREGYLLDKQMNALERKHETEGGYSENLLKKRLAYKYKNS